MIALYIVAGILLLLAAILCLPVRLSLAYRDDLRLVLRVLGIPFLLYPKKEKPLSTRVCSPKRQKKRAEKEKRKAEKKQKKKVEKAEKKKAEKAQKKKNKRPFTERVRSAAQTVRWITHLVFLVLGKFFSRLDVRVHRLHITVATGDAADTALAYGGALAAGNALITLLQKAKRFRVTREDSLAIQPDFCAAKSAVDVKITFSIRPYQVLSVALTAAVAYLTRKNKA